MCYMYMDIYVIEMHEDELYLAYGEQSHKPIF